MARIITTDDGQRYKIPGRWTNSWAITAGQTAGGALQLGASFAMLPLIKKMGETSTSCDNALLRQGIKDAFVGGGANLSSHGVQIIDVKCTKEFKLIDILKDKKSFLSTENMPEPNLRLNKALKEALPFYMKNHPMADFYVRMIQNQVEAGKNAFYLPKGKIIGVNIEKLGASTFHEMGHAINHNCSKFWNAMQKARGPLKIAGGTFAAIALCKRKKVEGEEPKNPVDKTTTFIKNNVGKLVTLSFVPIIAEELMASYRGNKMAAKVLPKELVKNVKTCNRLGALSYVGGAIVAGVSAVAASKIRDSIAKPKQI